MVDRFWIAWIAGFACGSSAATIVIGMFHHA